MRVLPVIVLLFLIVPMHVSNAVGPSESRTMNIVALSGNQTIGGYGYNTTFYASSNLSILNQSSISFINVKIIFNVAAGTSFFNIEGNLSLFGSSISTTGSLLHFNDSNKRGNFLKIVDSNLTFSGDMNVSWKNLTISNSTFAHALRNLPLRTVFLNDTGEVSLSRFNVTCQSGSGFSRSYSASQNGQPIVVSGNDLYSGSENASFIPLIDQLVISLNYTLGNGTGTIGFHIGNATLGYYNESISLNEGSNCDSTTYTMNSFSNISSFPETGKIPVSVFVPFGENVTIWHSNIIFNSNDSLYKSGISHNFIIFSHSRIQMANDIISSNNVGEYSLKDVLNPLKTGVYLTGNSTIIFISPLFYGGDASFDPVICSANSTMFILSEVLQRIESGNSSIVVNSAGPVSSGGSMMNASLMESMELNSNKMVHGLGGRYANYSTALVFFKDKRGGNSTAIYDFKFLYGSWAFYFSTDPSRIFSGDLYYRNYSVNASYDSVKLATSIGNNSISVDSYVYGNFAVSRSISMAISIGMPSFREEYSFNLSELNGNSGEWFNHTFTFSEFQNTSRGIISWIFRYNNSLVMENESGVENITVPGAMNTFIIRETNLNISNGWIASFNGVTHKSMTSTITVYLPLSSVRIFVPEQRLCKPASANITAIMGKVYNITFMRILVEVHIDLSGNYKNSQLTIRIGNRFFSGSISSLNVTLPMGNYTISVYSGSVELCSQRLYIHAMNQNVNVQVPQAGTDQNPWNIFWNNIWIAFLLSLIVFLYIVFSRKMYMRFCTACLSEVSFLKPMHRCPKKNK
ncbi:MAG: hypothetical protein ACYCR7_08110 [Thermoplasmataceae archaeon]